MTAGRRGLGPTEPADLSRMSLDLYDVRGRVAQIDGNTHDPEGGRMGRAEKDIENLIESGKYNNRLLITTLLASIGSLIGMGVMLVMNAKGH